MWAFGYNTGLIPVAAGALVPVFGPGMYEWLPFLAAGAMAMSSVSVVSNSLLLGRYKPRYAAENAKERYVHSESEIKKVYAPEREETATT